MLPVKYLCRRISPPDLASLSPAAMLATSAFTVHHRGFSLQLQEPPVPGNTTRSSKQLCLTCGARNRLQHYEADGVFCSKESHEKCCFSSCNSDCRSQLLPPHSGYQSSCEICSLRLRRKGFRTLKEVYFIVDFQVFQNKNIFHNLVCFSLFQFKCSSKCTRFVLGFFLWLASNFIERIVKSCFLRFRNVFRSSGPL